jgi:hypothetical protein
MIRTECPHCEERLDFGDEAGGTRVRCPECRKQFRLPQTVPERNKEPRRPLLTPRGLTRTFIWVLFLIATVGVWLSYGQAMAAEKESAVRQTVIATTTCAHLAIVFAIAYGLDRLTRP